MIGVLKTLFVTVCACLYGVESTTRQDIQDLHDKLLPTYNKDLGPNFNQSQPIVLYITFNLFTLNEFDDKAGKLVFLGVSTIQWQDDRMVWDPLLHGNTTSLMIPQSKVWIPNLFVAKPYDNVKKVGNDIVQITYTPDGWASWSVPDLFEVSCTANVAYYPFDRQSCQIYIIPWAYGVGMFDFRLPLDSMTQLDFIENGIWKVLSTKLFVENHEEGDIVVMEIKFQRRPLFVILNLLLPIVVVGVLNVFVFLLPPEPGERSAFGMTVLLAMAVFLSIVSDKLPSTSEPHIARVTLYILAELIISGLIMVFTIFSLVLYSKKDDRPIPGCIKRFVLMCTKRQRKLKKHTPDRRNEQTTEEQNKTAQRDWPFENDRHRYDYMDLYDKYRGYPNGNAERRQRGHLPQMYNQNNRDNRQTPPESPVVIATEDTSTNVTWTDVAKCFDNVCLALFIFLNLCLLVVETIDSASYLNNDF
ncbi:neuronal acetylcholine receptor subunit beta-3-like [Ylistrum balloti]|uniref:neuronal acetylcholine receptor subunit beta-3-like n=1 Tax=Ylistrum balloti TaxID=509963 RepID=UPI002905CA5D|nr:neuronal acetylcholine receptor subunit beta-3-like [Ylistrum balloti]